MDDSILIWIFVIGEGILVLFFILPSDVTREQRQARLIIFAVGLLLASILYSPHRITEERIARPFNALVSTERGSPPPEVYIKYHFIWEVPRNSALDFGRLSVTWLGIAALAGLALYLNHSGQKNSSGKN